MPVPYGARRHNARIGNHREPIRDHRDTSDSNSYEEPRQKNKRRRQEKRTEIEDDGYYRYEYTEPETMSRQTKNRRHYPKQERNDDQYSDQEFEPQKKHHRKVSKDRKSKNSVHGRYEDDTVDEEPKKRYPSTSRRQEFDLHDIPDKSDQERNMVKKNRKNEPAYRSGSSKYGHRRPADELESGRRDSRETYERRRKSKIDKMNKRKEKMEKKKEEKEESSYEPDNKAVWENILGRWFNHVQSFHRILNYLDGNLREDFFSDLTSPSGMQNRVRSISSSVQFLVQLPDNIKNLDGNGRFLFFGFGLFLCGVASLINGAVAVATGATKEFFLHDYVNTHWITTIFLLAGSSTILAYKTKRNYFLFSATCLAAISAPVALGALIFDAVNLHEIGKNGGQVSKDNVSNYAAHLFRERLPALMTYGIIDIINCLMALVHAIGVLIEAKRLASRYFSPIDAMKSRSLIACSFIQCIIGHFKFVLWILEVVWGRNLGQAKRFVFFNYTIDEPIWNLIYVMIGIAGIFAAKNGNKILCYCTLLFTGLSIFPVLQYLWVDYRWLLNVKSSDFVIQVPKPHLLLQMNIFLSCLHLIFIFFTVGIMLDRFVRNRLPWNTSKVSIEGSLKQSVLFSGILLSVAGVILLIMDVSHMSNGTFYRVFSPTEHRLPFLLIPAGVVALCITVRNEYLPYALPCCLPLLVTCVQSAAFNVVTFLYLSHNSYFTDQLCDLFYFGRFKCDKEVESFGVVSHFFEAAVSLGCVALCVYLMVIFYRLTNLYRTLLQYPLTDNEILQVKGHSQGARFFAIFQMVIGASVFVVSIYAPAHDQYKSILYHPFILIHILIYRVTLSIPFILNPLIQCFTLWSSDSHIKPLKGLLTMAISYVWTLDIFLQLDYRILSSLGVGWSIIVCLELLTLIVQFALAAECAILIDIGQNRLPQFDFVEYDRNGAESPTGTLNFNDQFDQDADEDGKSSGANDLV